jgi:hypothetical protein
MTRRRFDVWPDWRAGAPRAAARRGRVIAALAACLVVLATAKGVASPTCPDERETRQVPTDSTLCAQLEPVVRQPSALPLDQYEAKLGQYLANFCHRDLDKGWVVDKHLRNTGPYAATYANRKWSGESLGTHPPVLIWYSPDMYRWMKKNRPETGPAPAQEAPIPDGAIIVKEIYPAPAAACGSIAWDKLRPVSQGATIMVRDGRASRDGWFGAGSDGKDGSPTGRITPPRATIRRWASGSIAPTAIRQRKPIRPFQR